VTEIIINDDGSIGYLWNSSLTSKEQGILNSSGLGTVFMSVCVALLIENSLSHNL
jgi:hypothetical protein